MRDVPILRSSCRCVSPFELCQSFQAAAKRACEERQNDLVLLAGCLFVYPPLKFLLLIFAQIREYP